MTVIEQQIFTPISDRQYIYEHMWLAEKCRIYLVSIQHKVFPFIMN